MPIPDLNSGDVKYGTAGGTHEDDYLLFHRHWQLTCRCKKDCRMFVGLRGSPWIAFVAEQDSKQFYHALGFARMEGHIPLIYRGES